MATYECSKCGMDLKKISISDKATSMIMPDESDNCGDSKSDCGKSCSSKE